MRFRPTTKGNLALKYSFIISSLDKIVINDKLNLEKTYFLDKLDKKGDQHLFLLTKNIGSQFITTSWSSLFAMKINFLIKKIHLLIRCHLSPIQILVLSILLPKDGLAQPLDLTESVPCPYRLRIDNEAQNTFMIFTQWFSDWYTLGRFRAYQNPKLYDCARTKKSEQELLDQKLRRLIHENNNKPNHERRRLPSTLTRWIKIEAELLQAEKNKRSSTSSLSPSAIERLIPRDLQPLEELNKRIQLRLNDEFSISSLQTATTEFDLNWTDVEADEMPEHFPEVIAWNIYSWIINAFKSEKDYSSLDERLDSQYPGLTIITRNIATQLLKNELNIQEKSLQQEANIYWSLTFLSGLYYIFIDNGIKMDLLQWLSQRTPLYAESVKIALTPSKKRYIQRDTKHDWQKNNFPKYAPQRTIVNALDEGLEEHPVLAAALKPILTEWVGSKKPHLEATWFEAELLNYLTKDSQQKWQ